MDSGNKKNISYTVKILALVICVIIIVINSHSGARNWQLKGVVSDVWYNYQDFPIVTINNKEYHLQRVIWNYYFKIHKGDTIIKQKGDLRIKLIRPNTTDTIYFDNNDPDPINWHFNGVVQNVLHGGKRFAYIIVNGREYELNDIIWNLNTPIHKGDILTKKEGDLRIEVIRPNNNDTLFVEGQKM